MEAHLKDALREVLDCCTKVDFIHRRREEVPHGCRVAQEYQSGWQSANGKGIAVMRMALCQESDAADAELQHLQQHPRQCTANSSGQYAC